MNIDSMPIPELHKEILHKIHTKGYQKRFAAHVYKYFVDAIDEFAWQKTLDYLVGQNYFKKVYEIECPCCDSTIDAIESIEYKDRKIFFCKEHGVFNGNLCDYTIFYYALTEIGISSTPVRHV